MSLKSLATRRSLSHRCACCGVLFTGNPHHRLCNKCKREKFGRRRLKDDKRFWR